MLCFCVTLAVMSLCCVVHTGDIKHRTDISCVLYLRDLSVMSSCCVVHTDDIKHRTDISWVLFLRDLAVMSGFISFL